MLMQAVSMGSRMEESLKDWYQKTEKEVLEELRTSKEGLSEEEAAGLLASKGENILEEGKKKKHPSGICRAVP